MSLSLAVVLLHLAIACVWPDNHWLTCTSWSLLYVFCLGATWREQKRHEGLVCRRWRLLSLHFALAVVNFLCLMYAEIGLPHLNAAVWVSNVFRTWRLLPLLLLVCIPDGEDYTTNRVTDRAQIFLIGLNFLLLYLPEEFFAGGWLTEVQKSRVNAFCYGEGVLVVLLAILAWRIAQSAEARVLHRVSLIYLLFSVPILIGVNHFLINQWALSPSAPQFVIGDIPMVVYLIALMKQNPSTDRNDESIRASYLRLAGSVVLPLCAISTSILLVGTSHSTVLAVTTGILSLGIYGARSMFGQHRLLSAQLELSAANERLHLLSQHDPLTGLYNRRWLDENLAHEWKRAQRAHKPISLALIDVDYFKEYNDSLGHAQGDACLLTVAQTMAAQLRRGGDALVRYGGEEFLLLLPLTGSEGLQVVTNAIFAALEKLNLPHAQSPIGRVSVSLGGVTCTDPGPDDKAETAVLAADQAMYRAKELGRNLSVCVDLQ